MVFRFSWVSRLHHADDPQPLILHEALEGLFAPSEIHHPHRQDETDKYGADKGHGQGLDKGTVIAGGACCQMIFPSGLIMPIHVRSP